MDLFSILISYFLSEFPKINTPPPSTNSQLFSNSSYIYNQFLHTYTYSYTSFVFRNILNAGSNPTTSRFFNEEQSVTLPASKLAPPIIFSQAAQRSVKQRKSIQNMDQIFMAPPRDNNYAGVFIQFVSKKRL